ncbi:hypothetical protein ABW19_dt0201004 [Dactylella cylindrospora]|nr:hypothetical protein ABW19_dt0201004 [Dactylella cylindrospora]
MAEIDPNTYNYFAKFGDYYPEDLYDLIIESQEAYKNRPPRPNYPEKTVPEGWPSEIPPGPLVWNKDTFPKDGSYVLHISSNELIEVEAALSFVEDLSLTHSEINRSTFPLPTLGPRLDAACRQVHFGIGITIVSGLPSHKYTDDQNLLIFVGLSSYFGETRGRQRDDGSRLVHIFHAATRGLKENLSPIFNNHAQVFHNDIVTDILAMYCVSAAASGGVNHFASIPYIYNVIAKQNPEMIHTLSRPDWPFDTYGYNPPFHTRPLLFWTPLEDDDTEYTTSSPDSGKVNGTKEPQGRLIASLSPRQLSGSKVHPRPTSIPPLTPPQSQALQAIETLAQEHCIAHTLQPGQILFLNNLAVLHNRSAYKDSKDIPAEKHRHLIRMFIRNEELAWKTPRELEMDWGRVFGDFGDGESTGEDGEGREEEGGEISGGSGWGSKELWVADKVKDFKEQQRGLIGVKAGANSYRWGN